MKLVHPDFFFQIELPENKVPVLVFESPSRFLEFVSQIKGQVNGDNGEWVLSEGGKELNLAKTCEVIIDVFALDINQKKMITSLYNHLEKIFLIVIYCRNGIQSILFWQTFQKKPLT